MKTSMSMLFFLQLNTLQLLPQLNELRTLYQKAAGDEASCKKLLSSLDQAGLSSPVCYAYKACAEMLMAKYTINPFSKLNYFNNGKNKLEQSVKYDPNNSEIRCLRFSIQVNAPGFLGYNSKIQSDLKFLLNAYPSINDAQLKTMLRNILLSSGQLTANEKKAIQ